MIGNEKTIEQRIAFLEGMVSWLEDRVKDLHRAVPEAMEKAAKRESMTAAEKEKQLEALRKAMENRGFGDSSRLRFPQ